MGGTAENPMVANVMETFLAAHGWQNAARRDLPGDFSARHYVRLEDNGRKALLMLMPQSAELRAFLAMQRHLDHAGVRVPAVYAADESGGLALIEDLGDADFASLLKAGGDAAALYGMAVDALAQLHRAPCAATDVPRFTPDVFLQQACLFLDVYGPIVLGKPFSADAQKAFRSALQDALKPVAAMAQSLMLRDFHAANIMVLPHEKGHRRAAIIDFQDGGIGPVAYDLASLLEDARLDVAPQLRQAMLERYRAGFPQFDTAAFMQAYHVLACQRHLRVLAILARRWAEKDAPQSEDFFRRVWGLLMLHVGEPSLQPVYAWLDQHVPPSARQDWRPQVMVAMPHTAFVLAAGFGMRMRPLTLQKPKPLLEVGGEAMLDHVLDRLQEAGVGKTVVNTHYLAGQIHAHLKQRTAPQVILSHEETLLDTGGGIKNALQHLGDAPIFAVNADLPWRDGAVPALKRMADFFDASRMDALLLLMPLEKARGFKGARGDFFMAQNGRLSRAGTEAPRPYVFISAQIVKPQLYRDIGARVFSNNLIWDTAEAKGRLYGLVHDGACYHVGTPEDLAEANRLLDDGSGWA